MNERDRACVCVEGSFPIDVKLYESLELNALEEKL